MHCFKFLFLIPLLFMIGCSSANIEQYSETEPRFILEEALRGEFSAHGQFIDRFGQLRRQFTADIKGEWDEAEQTLTLNEQFEYFDGQTDQRIWTIKKTDDHTYSGQANDVDETVPIRSFGNAVRMAYTYPVETKERTIAMQFEDWLWLQKDGVIINKTKVSKWGIKVGEILITFVPQQSLID